MEFYQRYRRANHCISVWEGRPLPEGVYTNIVQYDDYLDSRQYAERENWIRENLPRCDWQYVDHYPKASHPRPSGNAVSAFHFARHEDAIAFKMRWR